MKTMNFFLLLLAFLTSATFQASTPSELDFKKDPFSKEINAMLSRSTLTIEKELSLKVIFVVKEDRKIEIRSISSSHAGVNTFLEERLNGRQLQGDNWSLNKIYELPVRVMAIR